MNSNPWMLPSENDRTAADARHRDATGQRVARQAPIRRPRCTNPAPCIMLRPLFSHLFKFQGHATPEEPGIVLSFKFLQKA